MLREFPKYSGSRLIVVAARPGMGRLRYLCSMAEERAKSHPVLFDTLELPKKILNNRYRLVDENIIVYDSLSPSISELGTTIRAAIKSSNVRTVVIDYIDLLREVNADTTLSYLKSLANELDIEIITGVAVKKEKIETAISAPTIKNIKFKDTEAIDDFISLHNPEFYLPKNKEYNLNG